MKLKLIDLIRVIVIGLLIMVLWWWVFVVWVFSVSKVVLEILVSVICCLVGLWVFIVIF